MSHVMIISDTNFYVLTIADKDCGYKIVENRVQFSYRLSYMYDSFAKAIFDLLLCTYKLL